MQKIWKDACPIAEGVLLGATEVKAVWTELPVFTIYTSLGFKII